MGVGGPSDNSRRPSRRGRLCPLTPEQKGHREPPQPPPDPTTLAGARGESLGLAGHPPALVLSGLLCNFSSRWVLCERPGVWNGARFTGRLTWGRRVARPEASACPQVMIVGPGIKSRLGAPCLASPSPLLTAILSLK